MLLEATGETADQGEHVWHVHDHTDEFFLVLEGRFDITLRDRHEGEIPAYVDSTAAKSSAISPELRDFL